jgi:hypothetical protein
MSKYIVTYVRESYYSTVIDAEDIDEAREKAWDVSLSDLEHDYDSGVFKINSVVPQIGVTK